MEEKLPQLKNESAVIEKSQHIEELKDEIILVEQLKSTAESTIEELAEVEKLGPKTMTKLLKHGLAGSIALAITAAKYYFKIDSTHLDIHNLMSDSSQAIVTVLKEVVARANTTIERINQEIANAK